MTFRCGVEVTRLANELLECRGVTDKMEARPFTRMGTVSARACETEREEEDDLIAFANQAMDLHGNVAILTLYNHQVDRIRSAFESAGIEIAPRLRSRGTATDRITIGYLRGIINGQLRKAVEEFHPRPEATLKRWATHHDLRRFYDDLEGKEDQLLRTLLTMGAPSETIALATPGTTASEALADFLEGAACNDATGIHIDTIHASKGREWHAVAVAAADSTLDQAQQAANLVYVAVTRTKANFHATMSRSTRDPWSKAAKQVSPCALLAETSLQFKRA